MDIPMTFTVSQLIRGFLAICGGIAAIGVATGWIIKLVTRIRKPNADQDKRLDVLEEKVEEFERFFKSDKLRLETLEEGTRVTQRAILALLSHGIDGNDIDSMKKSKQELTDYLIRR